MSAVQFKQGVEPHSQTHQSVSNFKTYGCALVIIAGIGLLAVGVSVYGMQQGWWPAGVFNNFVQVHSLTIIVTSSSAGTALLAVGVVGLTKSDIPPEIDFWEEKEPFLGGSYKDNFELVHLPRIVSVNQKNQVLTLNCAEKHFRSQFDIDPSVLEQYGNYTFSGWTLMGRFIITGLDLKEGFRKPNILEAIHFYLSFESNKNQQTWNKFMFTQCENKVGGEPVVVGMVGRRIVVSVGKVNESGLMFAKKTKSKNPICGTLPIYIL